MDNDQKSELLRTYVIKKLRRVLIGLREIEPNPRPFRDHGESESVGFLRN